ncbi:putative DNA modification/repair radical SAM protein [Sphingobium ummariense]
MSSLSTRQKLEILADAAKYDASCASSGTTKRDSRSGKRGGIGSTEGMGICHAYAPDGRCISLLKILLTNSCIFDCHYCINRRSSDVRRARFTVKEVVDLTLSFYRRNYIEGLFLSSGIIRSCDYTMEQLVAVARALREEHDFRGYIHLKTIPDADPELARQAGLYADRLSINVELPSEAGLKRLAPEKDGGRIEGAMARMKSAIEDGTDARKRYRHAPRFAPAGQSTQMIVGADGADDRAIIGRASLLYDRHRLRRVYYSAFSPIPSASAVLPLRRPPLMREHRLYQSDWMMRFYGYSAGEVAAATDAATGCLPLDIDPKLAWALRHRHAFPVDVNHAPRELLLRVPGLGVKAVDRILASRRHRRLRLDDVARLTSSIARIRPFLVAADWRPVQLADRADLALRPTPPDQQLELFAQFPVDPVTSS